MAAPPTRLGWREFYRSLPPRGELALLTAVFLIFAPLALIYDLALSSGSSWGERAAWYLYSGLVAVCWVVASGRTWWIVAFVLPASFLIPAFFGRHFWRAERFSLESLIEMIAAIWTIGAGYVLFVNFIGKQGVESLRHRAEIALAQEIHEALVPPVSRRHGRFVLHGVSDAATEVGGDLLDAVEADGRLGLYVADVTGHGVPAGVYASMIKSAIRTRLRSGASLSALLGDLNEVLCELGRPGTFATFAALHLDGSDELELAVAGHPPVLHWRAASGEVDRYGAEHPPLGIVEGTEYATRRIRVAEGDLIVVLTDGLTEVFGRGGEEFGEERVVELVRAHAREPLETLYAILVGAARRHGPQEDDQTLLLVRVE